MGSLTDPKNIIAILTLVIATALTFTGKITGTDGLDFLKWIAGFYFGASAIVSSSEKLAISRATIGATAGTPEHSAMMKALGIVVSRKPSFPAAVIEGDK